MLRKGFLAVLLGLMLSTSLVFAVEKININTATSEQLQSLNGIGDATAMAIINYRQDHGAFNSVDELTNVKGIGDKKLSKWFDLLVVKDKDLN